jgi:photosystem II stability/assembly factor-like uncharacterized protein
MEIDHVKRLVLSFIIGFLLLVVFQEGVSHALPQKLVWEQVPLRNAAQRKAGLIGGEGLQQVHAIEFAQSRPEVVYMSTDTSRVWKSQDGGYSWRPCNKGFGAHGARSLHVDPVNADIVFAAGFGGRKSAEGSKNPNHIQGIYITRNGGENWSLVKRTAFFKQASKGQLFAFESDSEIKYATSVIYCGTFNDGLLRSADGGRSWQCVGFKGQAIIDIEKDWRSMGSLFVATENGLFRYASGEIEIIGSDLPEWPRSIAVCKNSPTVMYAALGKSGVYKSVDSGETFFACRTRYASSIFFSDVAVSSQSADIVYLRADRSGLRPLFSKNGGMTWQTAGNTDLGCLIVKEGFYFSSPFAVHPLEAEIALTASNGKARIIRTVNGGEHWMYSGSGFTGGHTEDIAFYGPGKMIFALTDFGLWRSEDNGSTFDELLVKRMMGQLSSSAVAVDNDTIVASIGSWSRKGLVVGRRNGRQWSYFPDITDRYKYIAFHPSDKNVIYAGAYRSNDRGYNWKKIKYAVRAVNPKDGDIVYGFASSGPHSGLLMKSCDQGNTWSSQTCPFGFREVQDAEVATDGWLFVATARGLYVFDGSSWHLKNDRNGLALDASGMCFVSNIEIDPKDPSRLFAVRRSPGYGKSNGIFMSENRGETWHSISGNLGPELSAWTIKIDPYSGAIYIGTYAGTWRHKPDGWE